MAENQVSRIQHRRGPLVNLSGVILNTGELGFAIDEGRVFIGNRTSDGATEDENIELFTENTPADVNNVTFNPQVGTAYTLVFNDAGKLVEMNNAAANIITVPDNTAVSFSVGTRLDIIRQGAGTTTVAAAGGVTINSRGGLLAISARYGVVTLIKRATNEWTLFGDI